MLHLRPKLASMAMVVYKNKRLLVLVHLHVCHHLNKLANYTLYQLTLIEFDQPVDLSKGPDFTHLTFFHLLYSVSQSLLYPCQQSTKMVIIYAVGEVFENAVQVFLRSASICDKPAYSVYLLRYISLSFTSKWPFKISN